MIGKTIEQQTEQTINNIGAILEADGASLRDVVKVTAHLSDASLFNRYNAVYARRFPRPYPMRTTVGSDLGCILRLHWRIYPPFFGKLVEGQVFTHTRQSMVLADLSGR